MCSTSSSMSETENPLRNAQRIVVKVGSSLVTDEGRGLDAAAIGQWCRQIAALLQGKLPGGLRRELILVSSGAVAEGMKRLGWNTRPQEIHALQAAAAAGQMGLVQMYESQLRALGIIGAQMLLTHADWADRARYLNARTTLLTLLRLGVVPVINENDSVVNALIQFGDNDTLGALVANLVEADALVILTDQKGLYSADPRQQPDAHLIGRAQAGDAALEAMAASTGSAIGKGGMLTKILAAKRAAASGACTVIAWGREPDVLLRLAAGEAIGTLLLAPQHKTQARKQWIANHLQLRGAVLVDAGAIAKLRGEGKSLLPIGMLAVQGEFSRGDVIAVLDAADAGGAEIARGLANYASAEARLLCRKNSAQIQALLGYFAGPEIIHRDNMVLAG